jgi:hypothetical protein
LWLNTSMRVVSTTNIAPLIASSVLSREDAPERDSACLLFV